MSENPYESPKTPPGRNAKRAALVASILSILAVPAAAIGGGTTCAGAAISDAASIPLGVGGGWVIALGILIAANQLLNRIGMPNQDHYNYATAFIWLAVASPIALFLGFMIGANGVKLVMDDDDATRLHFEFGWFLTAGIVTFALLSLSFWIGLRWRRNGVAKPP